MSKRTHWMILIGAAALFLFCIGVVVYAAWPFISSGHIDRQIEKLRSEGKPVSALDLAGPPIPDEENAALIYEQVFSELAKAEPRREISRLGNLISERDRQSDPAAWDEAGETLVKYSGAFDLAEKAAARPKCRFRANWGDGWNTDLSYCSRLRDLGRLLAAGVMVSARDGRTEEAMCYLELGIRVGESLKAEPTIVPLLTRVSMLRVNSRALRYTLNHCRLDSEQARRLYDHLAAIDLNKALIVALEGERAQGIAIFEQLKQKGMQVLDELSNERTQGGQRPRIPGSGVIRVVLKGDQAVYIREMAKQIASIGVPYRETKLKNLDTDPSRDLPGYAIVSRTLLTQYSRSRMAADMGTASISASRILLATQAYRDRFGAYPESLSELRSKLGWRLPQDIFSGKDFVYKRDGQGFVLYSIGPNLKDEGGKEVDAPRNRDRARYVPEGDLVWKIER